MPLYEYQCEKCGNLFEVIQKFADAPIAKHEKCGGSVRRLLSAPALVFKGSGFYVNDYAKGSGSGSGSVPNPGSPTARAAYATSRSRALSARELFSGGEERSDRSTGALLAAGKKSRAADRARSGGRRSRRHGP